MFGLKSLFGSIGKAAKGVAKGATGAVGKAVKGTARGVNNIVAHPKQTMKQPGGIFKNKKKPLTKMAGGGGV